MDHNPSGVRKEFLRHPRAKTRRARSTQRSRREEARNGHPRPGRHGRRRHRARPRRLRSKTQDQLPRPLLLARNVQTLPRKANLLLRNRAQPRRPQLRRSKAQPASLRRTTPLYRPAGEDADSSSQKSSPALPRPERRHPPHHALPRNERPRHAQDPQKVRQAHPPRGPDVHGRRPQTPPRPAHRDGQQHRQRLRQLDRPRPASRAQHQSPRHRAAARRLDLPGMPRNGLAACQLGVLSFGLLY